ncbi:MAG: molecular chaperone HtpG [Oscillospiraceae bacterium]|nr:molecular chaperone HtpG [Oscillospiraceae bacterium]
MPAKKQFKAESKRLLELMINSIYTHKEIFLRELISNASDAMDKLYFKSLSENIGLSRGEFEIFIAVDNNSESRTLTITDNGIGMTKDELEQNLGVIAKSGTLQFSKDNEDAIKSEEDMSVIGQFGVGFYSAFMVASKVEVKSRAYGEKEAYLWSSSGTDGYTIEPCEKESHGTEIKLFIKENVENEDGEENTGVVAGDGSDYNEFLLEYKIRSIIKKYSDYIRYPIKMECVKRERNEENPDEYTETKEVETLNSMIPIWKKNKSELKDEDYNEFYKSKFHDYTEPLARIHSKTEGTATYSALLFIPQKPPYDFYTKEYEKGLQLYSNGVMIMEKCGDLLPDYFSFAKGLVDSEDLSLNISREMLQHDRQLKIIARSIERSIKNELKKMLSNEREKYEEFWKTFGVQLKFGIYNTFGSNKESLQDLLIFHSSSEEKFTTLDEYVTRMKEEQKNIYYASGESIARINSLPQVEAVKDKGFEILYLTDNVDEFCLQMLVNYNEKQFMSVQSADLDLETEEEKEEIKKKNTDNKALFDVMKEALSEKVQDVRFSQKLKTHPVCISGAGALSVEMEKVLAAMPDTGGQKAKADKILEINAAHPICDKLQFLYDNDKELLKTYADILYSQALLIEGINLENPAEFVGKITDLITK